MVLATMILLRCHQVPGCERADDALTERYLTESGGTATPGTMASIMAVDLDPLRDAVAASQGAGAVEIAIVNSRRSYVLAGSPRALVEFWFGHGRRLVEGGARWSFLPTTAPFHSSLLEPAVRLLRADSAFIGYDITGPQLALPVYVAESPHNLQDRPSSFGAFLEQAISRPVDWFATVTEAVDRTRPDHLLDFGPGPAARVFARECLQQIGYGLRYRTLSHSRRR
jgi:malonyl CoA-acyl carrier protein transacylase